MASGGSSIELSEWVRWAKLEARARVVGNLLRPPLPKRGRKEMLAVIYVIGISVVAAFLFAAVNEIEPDRRLALALFLIVLVSAAAIAGRLMP